jgi:hypothetical protein
VQGVLARLSRVTSIYADFHTRLSARQQQERTEEGRGGGDPARRQSGSTKLYSGASGPGAPQQQRTASPRREEHGEGEGAHPPSLPLSSGMLDQGKLDMVQKYLAEGVAVPEQQQEQGPGEAGGRASP